MIPKMMDSLYSYALTPEQIATIRATARETFGPGRQIGENA
ncbi:hypothetical protein RG903_02765 [Thermithiobacillus tepidarius DSM 3134]|nr:hypothetical protein [Thermithiobacillus tepidarius]